MKKTELIANPYQKIAIPKKLRTAGLKLRTRTPIAITSKPKMKELYVTILVTQAQTCPKEHTHTDLLCFSMLTLA